MLILIASIFIYITKKSSVYSSYNILIYFKDHSYNVKTLYGRIKVNERGPIGIFDSGIGGLSVLNHLIKHLPNEDFIYIADNKNFPYGLKSSEVIESIILRIGYYFEEVGVKAIVIACNTASSKVDFLRKHLKVSLISIIEATARNAILFLIIKPWITWYRSLQLNQDFIINI